MYRYIFESLKPAELYLDLRSAKARVSPKLTLGKAYVASFNALRFRALLDQLFHLLK
jgi:hypothetical protein